MKKVQSLVGRLESESLWQAAGTSVAFSDAVIFPSVTSLPLATSRIATYYNVSAVMRSLVLSGM